MYAYKLSHEKYNKMKQHMISEKKKTKKTMG